MSNPLKTLPAVDVVLRHEAIRPLLEQLPRVQIVQCIRQVLDTIRARMRQDTGRPIDADEVARQTVVTGRKLLRQRLGPVINATGIVLHTNLGRGALADVAVERISAAARYANLELSLTTGKRARRGAHAEELLKTLTGANDALIVNNCAAATILALQGIAVGREVIISRGQLVEIGGGFRLPDVFEAAGVVLREVGTTNRTQLDDYDRAVTENTAAVLRVHRSNFRTSGFVTEPSAAELVRLARTHNLPMIDDLGSGCMTRLEPLGLNEPDVATSLRAGADLILFSGDKLLGGPQAGILLGNVDWITRLRRHPMARAMRVCKLTFAALEATLELHLSGNTFETVPTLQMLATPAAAIRERCTAVISVLAEGPFSSAPLAATVEPCHSEVGGGSLADQTLDSYAVRLTGVRPETVLEHLRTREFADSESADRHPPILGRIEDGAVLLDLRTVRSEDDPLIVDCLSQMSAAFAGADP